MLYLSEQIEHICINLHKNVHFQKPDWHKMSLKRIGSKFLVISWKNLLLKRRHWFMTILEVVLPIILFVLIAVLRCSIEIFCFLRKEEKFIILEGK